MLHRTTQQLLKEVQVVQKTYVEVAFLESSESSDAHSFLLSASLLSRPMTEGDQDMTVSRWQKMAGRPDGDDLEQGYSRYCTLSFQ
jgi:hypothetical protein